MVEKLVACLEASLEGEMGMLNKDVGSSGAFFAPARFTCEGTCNSSAWRSLAVAKINEVPKEVMFSARVAGQRRWVGA